jgi:hypothetical protein
MSPGGVSPGPEGTYLSRARSLCLRGEALGGRLIAWSAALVALAWSDDAIEEAILFAAGIRDEALSPERAWSSGIAEGEVENLGPDRRHLDLAWGLPLLAAASLARLARPGEVVVDAGVSAFRAGRLSVLEERTGPTDFGVPERVGGWRLDLERPWKTPETQAPQRNGALADHIRKVARGDESGAAIESLGRLRRARARAEGGSAATRCQAALALGMMLSIAGRPEDALLEALDALARAREAQDVKAVAACTALLAKLYVGAGLPDAAAALRDGAGV